MKLVLLSLLTASLATTAMAKTNVMKREPAATAKCKETALDAVKYIDKLGWGEGSSKEYVKVVSSNRRQGGFEDFQVTSEMSDYTYKVKIIQDSKSEACIILSVVTE